MEEEKRRLLARKWLEIAEQDFEMSEICFGKGKYLYAAFHLQQAIEKILKGLFVLFRGEQPPYIHDLSRLVSELENDIEVDMGFRSFFAELNPFYIRSRYPDYKKFVSKDLDLKLVQKFLQQGKEVVGWLQSRV